MGGWATSPVPFVCVGGRGGQHYTLGDNMVQKWADRLDNPCRLGDTQHFKAEDKISSRPQVGAVAT